ncbi:hypothetical protein A2U01_0043681, partial [Trifolium medium]|nr:hypothetical protein [Trifolium medium]
RASTTEGTLGTSSHLKLKLNRESPLKLRAETLLDEDQPITGSNVAVLRLNTQLAMGGSSRGEGTLRRARLPLIRGYLLLGPTRARKSVAQIHAKIRVKIYAKCQTGKVSQEYIYSHMHIKHNISKGNKYNLAKLDEV